MTKQEARVWVNKCTKAAEQINRNIERWHDASAKAMKDLRYDRLASYFEFKAIEIYMNNGGDNDFLAVHVISAAYREMQQAEN